MKTDKKIIKILFFFTLLIFFQSCSTKKKTWFHRTYHNTTAKYNGYFNGNESLKKGIKKLHQKNKDDYTSFISVFPTSELENQKKSSPFMDKAIKKGSIVIQRHSIKIDGKEYCKWIDDNYLMIGKAYFYKADFEEAIKTFTYIINEYPSSELAVESKLWLIRSSVGSGDFEAAESYIEDLNNEKKLSKKNKKLFSAVCADYYVQKGEYEQAIAKLIEAANTIKSKREKVRINYLLAQIYQNKKEPALARERYEMVLKASPEYEMAFNAKMNLARSLEKGDGSLKKTKENLLKMTKDDKNAEYLDQIYFTIAEMDLNNNDTASAKENYNLSTINSVDNNTQKAISFLALAKIELAKKQYLLSSQNYDSAVFYMQEQDSRYKTTKQQQQILFNLSFHIRNVQLQDSLLVLSKLPKEELDKKIKQLIEEEIKKARLKEEEKKAQQQAVFEGSRNNRDRFGENTGGGKWYFYNPATLSYGLSEFRKKWGSRKLEDDWRRKNKNSLADFVEDSIRNDSITALTENKQDPNYYLQKIPKTNKDVSLTHDKIKESLYQVGIIFREDLKKITASTDNFAEIYIRYPEDKEYSPLALYNIYLNENETSGDKQNEVKNIMLKKYPKSLYTKILVNPNYKEEAEQKNTQQALGYLKVFEMYKNSNYNQVLSKTKNPSGDLKNKYLLLRALAQIKLKKTKEATKTLQQISKTDTLVYKTSKSLISTIEDPSKLDKANETAILGSPYLFRSLAEHMVVVVLPKEGFDVTYFKTLVSDFNIENIGNDVFEISALMLGRDRHLILIKSFENSEESLEYLRLLSDETKIKNILRNQEHKIMSISYENFAYFYKNKDTENYYKFFINKYNSSD